MGKHAHVVVFQEKLPHLVGLGDHLQAPDEIVDKLDSLDGLLGVEDGVAQVFVKDAAFVLPEVVEIEIGPQLDAMTVLNHVSIGPSTGQGPGVLDQLVPGETFGFGQSRLSEEHWVIKEH